MDIDENVAKQIVDMLLACHQSDEETVRRLITEGFDVNQSLMPFHPEMPGTPLMVAARVDDDKIVRILLQADDIDVNTTDRDNVSVAYHAIELRALKVVRLLREDPRVDWNLRSDNGGSPITRALVVCNEHILKIVLSVPEVNLNVLDFDNEDYGRLGLNLPQLIVFCERGNKTSCLACLELLMKEVEVRRQRSGATDPLLDWNRRFDNPAKDTPILYAIKNKKYKLVKMLLQTRGVDESIRDKSGLCVHDIARRRGLTAILALLSQPRRVVKRICWSCKAVGAGETRSDGRQLLKCGGCLRARYCDEECQAADYERHQDFCTNLHLHQPSGVVD